MLLKSYDHTIDIYFHTYDQSIPTMCDVLTPALCVSKQYFYLSLHDLVLAFADKYLSTYGSISADISLNASRVMIFI